MLWWKCKCWLDYVQSKWVFFFFLFFNKSTFINGSGKMWLCWMDCHTRYHSTHPQLGLWLCLGYKSTLVKVAVASWIRILMIWAIVGKLLGCTQYISTLHVQHSALLVTHICTSNTICLILDHLVMSYSHRKRTCPKISTVGKKAVSDRIPSF